MESLDIDYIRQSLISLEKNYNKFYSKPVRDKY